MTTLRDIMTKPVVTIAPELTIRDAMSLLSSCHISGAPVVVGEHIEGVVSATDLLAFAAEQPGAPAERQFNEELEELPADENVDEDPDAERELDPKAAFYTDLWDDAGADTTVRFSTADGPEWNVLDEHTVEEVMTRAPILTLPVDTPVPVAAEFLRAHNVHRVLVTENGKLQGIATASDIAFRGSEPNARQD
jgi:CBS domain-containing protein